MDAFTTESTSFSISFQPDFWTRFRASLTLLHRNTSTWVAYVLFVAIPALMLIHAFITGRDLTRRGGFGGLPQWMPLCFGFVLVFGYYPLALGYRLWSVGRRARKAGGVQHYELNAEGVSMSGATYNSQLKWAAISQAVETGTFFFLYVSSRTAFYIPKEDIAAEDDLLRLRSILAAALPGKAKLRSTALDV